MNSTALYELMEYLGSIEKRTTQQELLLQELQEVFKLPDVHVKIHESLHMSSKVCPACGRPLN